VEVAGSSMGCLAQARAVRGLVRPRERGAFFSAGGLHSSTVGQRLIHVAMGRLDPLEQAHRQGSGDVPSLRGGDPHRKGTLGIMDIARGGADLCHGCGTCTVDAADGGEADELGGELEQVHVEDLVGWRR